MLTYVWLLTPMLAALLVCAHLLDKIAKSLGRMEANLNDIRYQVEKAARDNEWVGADEYRHGNEL